MNECLLGGVVFVGIGFLIDCYMMVEVLGFDCLLVNSFDFIFDCDFVFEFLLVLLICVMYLFCFVEELVIWLLV